MSLANSNSSPLQLIGTLIRGVGEPMLLVDSKGAVIDYNNQAKKLVGDDSNTPVEIGLSKMGITKDWFLQKVFSLPTSSFPINISSGIPISSWSASQNVLCNGSSSKNCIKTTLNILLCSNIGTNVVLKILAYI